ncbi:MAG: signal peptidase I [Anaerolineaceae bacterium]
MIHPQKTRLESVLTIVCIVVAWALVAPTTLGGQLKYAIISGNSMLPLMTAGDLAIVREAPYYQIGDVVAYNHPEIGMVIHRIVAQHGEHFVLRGDNNSWTDGYYPTLSDIHGKLWLWIPRVGKAVAAIKEPWIFSLLMGMSILLFGWSWIKPSKTLRKRIRD